MTISSELKKLVLDWIAFAQENLLSAIELMKAAHAPYHTACVLCQGSAEKCLKGYLISRGWELKKIHDLKELLGHAVKYNQAFDTLFPQAGILNQYITEGRYPGDLPFEAIGKADAEEAIAAAEHIEKFVLQKLADFLN